MSLVMPKATLPGVGSPLRLSPVTNIERMYALDEAWNARDWERSTPTTTRAASSSTGRAANAPHAWRSGSSRRVRAVLRSVPR